MNTDNFNKLIRALQTGIDNVSFNMAYWLAPNPNSEDDGCGTAACIGGHVEMLMCKYDANTPAWAQSGDFYIHEVAQWLDIPKDHAHSICYPDLNSFDYITADDAIKMLKNYMKHQIVNWNFVYSNNT